MRVEVVSLQPVQVHGDPVLLEQVVGNLIDNAAIHSRSRVQLALGAEGGAAVLTVNDDGSGIPPDQREAVFEWFVRLDHARARASTGGAGLGLAIVTAHRGTVEVADGPLGGARLTVRVPQVAEDRPTGELP